MGQGGLRPIPFDAVDVALSDEGKLVVAGNHRRHGDTDFRSMRLLVGGEADPSFNGGEFVTTDFGSRDEFDVNGLASDGDRPVITGYTAAGSLVARYGSGGSLDPTFSDNGWAFVRFAGFWSSSRRRRR